MFKLTFIVSLVALVVTEVDGAENDPALTAQAAGSNSRAPSARFDDDRFATVSHWVSERAPSCPEEITKRVATRFLEELALRHPGELERLSSPDFPLKKFESLLLGQIAASLAGPSFMTLREELARKRIAAILAAENPPVSIDHSKGEELAEKVRRLSQVYYRRLTEGRMEDDELLLLVKRVNSSGDASAAAKIVQPKVLGAAEIVSNYSRHNQTGSAAQRLRAYVVEGTLWTAEGQVQQLVLARLRPDRFRLMVRKDQTTELVLGFDGSGYWQQVPQRQAVELSKRDVKDKVYLSEFINPLLSEEGYTFEKLDDAAAEEVKVHRIRVRRADGSDYISCIDAEKFREVSRENRDGSIVSYSDFREVAGVTFAFREEIKDAQGRKAYFEARRIAANPGLVQQYFEPSGLSEPSSYTVEQWLPRAPRVTEAR